MLLINRLNIEAIFYVTSQRVTPRNFQGIIENFMTIPGGGHTNCLNYYYTNPGLEGG